MPWFIKAAFAGLGSLVWHWGIGVGLIILILAAEYFSAAIPVIGPWLDRFRKDLLWVAVGIGLLLAGQYIGAKDMSNRCEAKAAVVNAQVNDAVTNARQHPGLDRWDTDK